MANSASRQAGQGQNAFQGSLPGNAGNAASASSMNELAGSPSGATEAKSTGTAKAKDAATGAAAPAGALKPDQVGKPEGNVDQWINEARDILRQSGVSDDKMKPADLKLIIEKESSGNPRAINNWDSNAAKGTPSKGIMQTIDPTFQSFKMSGYDDIYNPVHNIIAATRYGIDRYGSMTAVADKKRGTRNDGF